MKNQSIGLIKVLKSLKEELTESIFNSILNDLGVDSNNFEERIKGLEREYEFISNLYICNACNCIVPIDEEFTTTIGEKSCDAIITLNNNEKIMLEVKTTAKDIYNISRGNFESRVNWAKQNGYKLYFAINLCNYWTLYSSEQINSWNLKVTIDNFPESLLSTVFGTIYYLTTTNIKFISTYSSNQKLKNLAIKDAETGFNLIKEEFCVDNTKVKEVTPNESNDLPLVLLSSEIRSRCTRIDEKINDYEIRSTYELDGNNLFCSFDIIKTTISEMQGPTLKHKYNAFLKLVSEKDKRDMVNIWLKELAKTLKMKPCVLLSKSEMLNEN